MTDAERPARLVLPGAILKTMLDARGWTQRDLAEVMGRPPQTITEIIRGTKQITPDTALELAAALGLPAQFWTNLETQYRLAVAARHHIGGPTIAARAKVFGRLPVGEMVKRGWIKGSRDVDTLQQQAQLFLNVADVDAEPKTFVNLRRSAFGDEALPGLRAWVRRVEIMAQKVSPRSPFSKTKLHALITTLRRLAKTADGVAGVPEALSTFGIQFAIVAPMARTKVDGVAMYGGDGTPIIGLSLRFDRIDWFWFTLLHELAHIALAHEGGHLDAFDDGETSDSKEQEANEYAENVLIDRTRYDALVRENGRAISKLAIEAFSLKEGIHPGIVVGRLQNKKVIPFSHHRTYLVKIRHFLSRWISD